MSRTIHAVLTADQRAERRAARRPRPEARRLATRRAILARELADTEEI